MGSSPAAPPPYVSCPTVSIQLRGGAPASWPDSSPNVDEPACEVPGHCWQSPDLLQAELRAAQVTSYDMTYCSASNKVNGN